MTKALYIIIKTFCSFSITYAAYQGNWGAVFSEISCNSNFSPPDWKRYPQKWRPPLVCLVNNHWHFRQGTLLGPLSFCQGQGSWQPMHCNRRMAGLLLPGLGMGTKLSILTLVLPISSMTFKGWHISNSLYEDWVTSPKHPLRKNCFISAKIRHLNMIFLELPQRSKVNEDPIIPHQHPALI